MSAYITQLNHQFALKKGHCALLVIDMQYASGSRDYGLGKWLTETGQMESASYRFERIEQVVVPGIQRLLQSFRNAGERVIYVTLGGQLADYSDTPVHMRPFFKTLNNHAGTREHDIIDELKPEPGEIVVNKTTQGAFASSRLESILKASGIEQIVCTGVSTNNCVETTAREASDRGYNTVLVSDATGTCSDAMQNMTLDAYTRLWGRVMTIDEVTTEMGLDSKAP
jgi:nicotinamidase-related amidase